MKATIEFSLPEETEEYEMYRRAPEYFRALSEFREWLRGKRKYEPQAGIEQVWDKFHDICEEFVNEL